MLLTMSMVAAGAALCLPGNHDMKLLRKLQGRGVQLTHGLADSVAQLEAGPPELRDRVAAFLDGLISHYLLDDGKLVVAHAGMKEEMQGRGSGAIRAFALLYARWWSGLSTATTPGTWRRSRRSARLTRSCSSRRPSGPST